jgi:thiol-disulfide isomerase/thioredoxin
MKFFWLAVIGILMASLSADAQPRFTNQGLLPGNTLPEATFTYTIHAQTPVVRLSNFKGKLLILDFWATWCGSCIAAFPRLDSLQKQFADRIQILCITDEDYSHIKDFLAKNKIASQVSLPFITNDSLLAQWFPHQSVPHEVWISPEGKILSMTDAGEITAGHIQKVLQGKSANLLQKTDRPDREPLLSADYLPKENLLHYSILLKGYMPGIPNTYRYSTFGQVVVTGIVNRPLLDLYRQVARHYIPHFSRKRILIQVADSSQLDYPHGYSYTWEKEHVYSYEIILPKKEKDSLYAYMLEDLNRYSGYHGSIETKEQRCLILKAIPGKKITSRAIPQIQTDPSDTSNLYGFTAETVISWLMGLKYLKLPIVEETGYSGKLFIDSKHKPSTKVALNKVLARHGLFLTNGRRPIPVLIISDKK